MPSFRRVSPLRRFPGAVPSSLRPSWVIPSLLLVLLWPAALQGQQVQGRLVDEVDAHPLAGAYVTLVRDGENVARAVTRVDGGFVLTAPQAGPYTLRADFLGYGVVEREVEVPPPGEPLRVELAAGQQAIELEGLVAEVDRQCDVPEGVARQVAALWDEVAEAFRVTAYMEEEQLFDMRMDRWERALDPEDLRILDEDRRQGRGILRGSPFESLPADDLASQGYVREMDDGSFSYFAPDARVLLSASFQDTHCFGVTVDPPSDGVEEWVGIRFEPRDDDRPDIHGVLWIDGGSLEPQRLDFRYSELPGRVGGRELGGRVIFQRLPAGPWIIREWRIRMPEVQAVQYYTFNSSELQRRYEVARIREVGGQVTQAGPRGGDMVALGETGSLRGRVLHASGQPAADARVALAGTVYGSRTDAEGRFRLGDLPGGRYRLTHTSPLLDSLELDGGGTGVSVTPGEVTEVEVRLASPATLLAESCTDPVMEDELGVLRGTVVPREGGTLVGVHVELTWADAFRVDRVGRTVRVGESSSTASIPVDDEGRWMGCGLPVDLPLTAQAVIPEIPGARGPTVEMRLRPDRFPVVELRGPGPAVVTEAEHVTYESEDGAPTAVERRIDQELEGLGIRRESLGRRFVGPERVAEHRQGSRNAVDMVRVLGLPGIRVGNDDQGGVPCIYASRNVRPSLSGSSAQLVCAAIVVDGLPGEIHHLQTLPAEAVAAMAFLRAGEAGARFGTGTSGGVLVVWTARGAG